MLRASARGRCFFGARMRKILCGVDWGGESGYEYGGHQLGQDRATLRWMSRCLVGRGVAL